MSATPTRDDVGLHTGPAVTASRSWLSILRERQAEGSWAALLALAPSFVLAAVFAVPTPLEPAIELIMQATPVAVANVLIGALGPFASATALLGALACTLPLGGLLAVFAPDAGMPRPRLREGRVILGSAWARRWALTTILAILGAAPLAVAAPYRGEAACALLAGALYAPSLALTRRWRAATWARGKAASRVTTSAGNPSSRRAFLRGLAASGVTVAGALALGSFEWWSGALTSALGRADSVRTLFRFAAPGPRRSGFPVAGEEAEVTPVDRFYVLSKNDVDPTIAPADWSLRITGAVKRDLRLTYADLLALPRVDQYATLRCVSNPVGGHLMSTAFWSGVPLAELLTRVGLAAGADAVVFSAPDAYDEVAALDEALAPTALLAYGMNGETLARRHGGPVRMLLPGFYGFKNVKWIEAITVRAGTPRDYWAARGWTAREVRPVARIDVWRREAAGLLVAGVAYTGTRRVSAVQVRADGGAWHDCTLNAPALSDLTWVQWQGVLPLTTGAHTLSARVIDGAGAAQDASGGDIFPGGAAGLHTISVHL